MPCKACHRTQDKPKSKFFADAGTRYLRAGETYILARCTDRTYALIELRSGNRWRNASSLELVGDPNDFMKAEEEN